MKKIIALCSVILLVCLHSNVFAQLNLSASVTNNSVCNFSPPTCPCNGKMRSLTVLYNGTNGVTVNVYKKSDLVTLIASFPNVQSGQILTVSAASIGGQFESDTYFHIAGTPTTSKVSIHTSCSRIIIGLTFGPYTVVGYTDGAGNICNMNVCNGSIDLSVSGGTAPYSYAWSNGSKSQDPIRLCPGTYTVTVKDNATNTRVQSFQVGQAAPNISASASTTPNSICGGDCVAECFESATIPDIVNAKSTWTINQQAGTVTIRTTLAKTFVDNTYGTNAIGWPSGHTFSNLTGSDNLEIALYDGNNVKKMQFKMDYITSSGAAPSGYQTLGVTGGEGQISLGSASDVLNVKTSLSENFNTFGYVLTANSPATDANYTPNPAYPNWIFEVWYEVTVKLSVFGSAGFGKPSFVSVHASPSKTGNNSEPVVDKGCCAFNCNGAINLTITSGTGPFTFKWSTGETTEDLSNVCQGNYTVTITDASGCTVSQTFNVGQVPPNITAISEATPNTQCAPPCPPGGEQLCFESPTIPNIVNAVTTWSIDQVNGTLTIRVTLAKTFVDNTYGANTIGWPGSHSFSNLTGSDRLELALYDANGVKRLDFEMDYLTATNTVPSGYKTLGVTGGDGDMIFGNVSDVLEVKTSLSENFNTFGYILTTNSPATDNNYTPNPAQPNWIFEVWYEATVKLSAFGQAGFGFPLIPYIHASPSKTGNNSEPVDSVHCIPPCIPLCDGSINLTVTAGTGPFSFKWSNGATSEDVA
ncbi:MAG TPA: SprB repeat-containing protein, partial [Chitinophagales bacterium]|nr:SprB repeat-containing protein [Chitinophagales bacterium]